jgi:hypothetical protein
LCRNRLLLLLLLKVQPPHYACICKQLPDATAAMPMLLLLLQLTSFALLQPLLLMQQQQSPLLVAASAEAASRTRLHAAQARSGTCHSGATLAVMRYYRSYCWCSNCTTHTLTRSFPWASTAVPMAGPLLLPLLLVQQPHHTRIGMQLRPVVASVTQRRQPQLLLCYTSC